MTIVTRWMSAHPYLTVMFTAYFTFIATFAGMQEFTQDPVSLTFLAALFIVGLLTLAIALLTVEPAVMAVLATALIASACPDMKAAEPPPNESQPELESGVAVAAAVVVVCVGSYCIYKMVKFCQKKFPKEGTNSNNVVQFYAEGGEGEYGASYNFGVLGSCAPDEGDFRAASDPHVATTFGLNVTVDVGGVLRTTMSGVRNGADATQDFLGFQAEVESHGLRITGAGDGSQYFSRNRIPCTEVEVPIRFDTETKAVIHMSAGEGLAHSIRVERSEDLVNWTPFFYTVQLEGARFRVEDTTVQGQMFYRVMLDEGSGG